VGVACVAHRELRELNACSLRKIGRSRRRRRRRRRRKVYSGANAVNEEDPERDRATQAWKTCSAVLRS